MLGRGARRGALPVRCASRCESRVGLSSAVPLHLVDEIVTHDRIVSQALMRNSSVLTGTRYDCRTYPYDGAQSGDGWHERPTDADREPTGPSEGPDPSGPHPSGAKPHRSGP